MDLTSHNYIWDLLPAVGNTEQVLICLSFFPNPMFKLDRENEYFSGEKSFFKT